MSTKKKDSDIEAKVGLSLVPSKEQAIEKLTEIEPEYESYLEKLPAKKRQRIVNSLNRIRTGLHSIAPMMCLGPSKCPIVDRCPIPERDEDGKVEFGPERNYPMGRECVLEKFYMQQKMIEYVEHLGVDPSNPVEMSIVNELSLIDLYKNRALMIMAVGDQSGQGRDFMRVDVIGFNENGETAETAKLHPAVDMIDKLEKRREKWLEKLMETRKSKADWAAKMGNFGGESKILGEIQKLREAISIIDSGTELQIEELEEEEILLSDD